MTLLPPAHKVTRHLVLIRSACIRPVPPHQAWDDQGLGIGGTGVSPSPSRLKAPHTVSRDGVALATGARFPSSNLRGSRWSWFLRIKIPCPTRHTICVARNFIYGTQPHRESCIAVPEGKDA